MNLLPTITPVPYADRIQAARTAYLSIPTYLKAQQDAILRDAQACFPQMHISKFDSVFTAEECIDFKVWRKTFRAFIANRDILIVACDSSRLATRGVVGEIDAARKQGKDVVLFKVDDKEWRRYWGYERMKSGGRLLKRAEGMAIRARLNAERAREMEETKGEDA